MFLVADGKPSIDYDLELLRELTNLLDARLEALDQQIQRCPDPDAFGLFDTAEGVCGLGFAACQQYLTATASGLGLEKSMALPCGPVHSCGDTIVSIVNHSVANSAVGVCCRTTTLAGCTALSRDAMRALRAACSLRRTAFSSSSFATESANRPDACRTGSSPTPRSGQRPLIERCFSGCRCRYAACVQPAPQYFLSTRPPGSSSFSQITQYRRRFMLGPRRVFTRCSPLLVDG
jgi:hypothetical protein